MSPHARRVGWVGCNILFDKIPRQGIIPIIRNGIASDIDSTVHLVHKAAGLNTDNIDSRGWIFDVLNCVNAIPTEQFALDEVYRYEDMLKALHPNNNNIRAKIRQQLQLLRNAGYIEFSERGIYKKLI